MTRRCVLCVLVLMNAGAVSAQSTLTIRAVTVQAAQPVRYQFDDDLVLRPTGGAALPASLQVRIFSNTKADLIWRNADAAGCVEYHTLVLGIESAPGGGLFVTHLNHNWLTPVGANRVGNARYVLVFEEAGSGDGVLRIAHQDIRRYFKYAVEIEVDKGQFSPKNVVETVAQIAQARGTVPPPPQVRTCARVKESTGAMALLVQDPCALPVRRGWWSRLFEGSTG